MYAGVFCTGSLNNRRSVLKPHEYSDFLSRFLKYVDHLQGAWVKKPGQPSYKVFYMLCNGMDMHSMLHDHLAALAAGTTPELRAGSHFTAAEWQPNVTGGDPSGWVTCPETVSRNPAPKPARAETNCCRGAKWHSI